MGACALVSLEQTIHHIMNDDKYPLSLLQQQQITSMNQRTISLQTFLEKFPEKVNNDSLRGRIRDAANEAERIMEYFMWRTINPRWITWMAKILFHFDLEKVAKQIESIAEEVSDSIKEARPHDDVDDGGVGDGGSRAATSTLSRRYSAPTGKQVAIVGFDGDLLAIQKRLCAQSSRSRLEVIPIVGMGGIGKTTLARYAYDNPLITKHFRIRAWVTVSQDYYSAHEVLLSLLDSLKESNIERFGRGFTDEEKVRRSLKRKRYLIVMDDICSTKAWEDVRRIFPDDVNGSRAMLTTRLFDVAAYASRANRHFMRFMNADQSWALLCLKVFGNKDCPHERM